MAKKKQESFAQFIDQFLQRTTIGVFLVALAYGTAAAKHFAGADMVDYLKGAKMVLGLLAVVIIVPSCIKLASWRTKNRADCAGSDGFIAGIYTKSAERAFSAAFVTMVVLEVLSRKALSHLPTAFFIQFALMVSLLALSLSFYFMSRDTGGDFDDEFDDEEQGV